MPLVILKYLFLQSPIQLTSLYLYFKLFEELIIINSSVAWSSQHDI